MCLPHTLDASYKVIGFGLTAVSLSAARASNKHGVTAVTVTRLSGTDVADNLQSLSGVTPVPPGREHNSLPGSSGSLTQALVASAEPGSRKGGEGSSLTPEQGGKQTSQPRSLALSGSRNSCTHRSSCHVGTKAESMAIR